MATFRRDKLLRLARAGRLVMVGNYHFDDLHGASRENVELPVRVKNGHSDWIDGYCNMSPGDFTSYGRAWLNPDGTIHLHIHSNHNIDFRILAEGEQAPEPVSQSDPRRAGV